MKRLTRWFGELDLLRVLSPSEPTLSFGPGKLVREGLIDDLEDMMTRRPSTCRVDEPLRAALKRVATMQIAQLVVVDADDRLLGLLRGRDIFRALFGERPGMNMLLALVVLILAARIGGELATRARRSPMLGEILAGLLLGPTALNLIAPNETLEFLSHLGILFMTFLAGMETDLRMLRKSPAQACWLRF